LKSIARGSPPQAVALSFPISIFPSRTAEYSSRFTLPRRQSGKCTPRVVPLR
jgi:hypothetical protein